MPKSSLRGYNKKKANIEKDEVKQKAKEMFDMDVKEDEISVFDDAKDMIDHYEDKSEDEMMGDLKQMIDAGRQDGSFNDDMLEQFYQTAAPMMDEEQKSKLDSLLNMIKKGEL